MKNSNLYLIISIITFIVGYIFLKFAYTAVSDYPFVQEIVLVVLGTIVTIAITAALLNKQSEVEMEKEQRVKIFDLKSNLYFELIDFLEKVISKEEINTSDLISLEFLTHKIYTLANMEVLKEYTNFLKTIKESAKDKKINPLESEEIAAALTKLCTKIRYDLISKEDNHIEIKKLIESNIDE